MTKYLRLFFFQKKKFHLSSKIRDTDIIVGTNSFQCCDVKFEISNFLFRSISIINNNELFLNYLLFILPINYLFLPSSTKTETPQRKNNPFDPLDLFSTKKKKKGKENPSYLRAQESPEFSFAGYSGSRIGFFALPFVFKERRTVFLFNSEPTLDRRGWGGEESIGVDTEFS